MRCINFGGALVRARIHNLSLGGCYVESEAPIAPESQLAIVLKVKDIELRVIAETKRVKTDLPYGVGLEFVSMTADGWDRLKSLIAELN